MTLISLRFLAFAALLTALVSASAATFSFAQEIKETTTYQVPTTGEIVDVIYRPEFDEWWVKCREGKAISVYSYDKRSKKWGRALFLPQRPDEKGKKTAKPDESAVSPEKKDRRPEELKERERSPDVAEPPAGSEQPPKKSEPARDKKKWWDPFNILKGDKKTLPPVDKPLP